MRNLSLLLALFPLYACTGGKDTGDSSAPADTDTDTDTDTDVEPSFEIVKLDAGAWDISGDCDTSTCDYTITTTTEAGLAELDMTQTGDVNCPADYPCWHEYHDEFVLGSINADGSETYSLHLEVVADPTDVTTGTTLLDSAEAGTVTWLFGAYSSDMADHDCVVTGESSTYYENECPNFW